MGLCVEIHLEKENCFRKLRKQKSGCLQACSREREGRMMSFRRPQRLDFFIYNFLGAGKVVELKIIYSGV